MKFIALFYQNPAGFFTALLLAIFTVAGFIHNENTGYIFLCAFILVFIVTAVYSALSLKSTRKYVKYLNKSLNGEDISSVDSFPLPCVTCDMRGNILWYNTLFDEVIGEENSKSLSMKSFFEDFKYNTYASKKIANAEYNSKKYTAFITKVKSVSNPMLCVYFFEDTKLKDTELEYIRTRPFMMLLFIDNIEQLSRQLTDSKFASYLSGIESLIENWLKNEKVLFKKIGNGNFLIIGQKSTLDVFCADKFSILTKIREYSVGDESLSSTLSIGVGTGESFAEIESMAKKALDMSLGRGGDQAAVYLDGGYIYYGGLANRSNDNSRVSPRQTAAKMATLIKKYKRVIIMGHKFSDFDSVGASLGVCFFSEVQGVEAFVVMDENTTLSLPLVNIAKENGFDNFITPQKAVEMCDADTLAVVVDTHRLHLLDSPDSYTKAGGRIIIDHHRRSDDYLTDADIFYHLPSPSSSCEMVAELIQYSTVQDKLPSFISTALLAGIVLDTKDYVLRTSKRTFEAAAFLRDNNADTLLVKKLFAVSSEMVSLKNQILSSAELYNGFMFSSTDSTSTDIRIVTSKAADDMLAIDGVRASFVILSLDNNTVQISARSLGEENVQLIMEYLGGGGHSTMAACQLTDVDFDEAKSKLKEAIDNYLLSK